jgi:prepilin peptidase CpaA
MLNVVIGTSLVIVMGAAGWFDLRERRIPNFLTLSALAGALVLRLFGGFESFADGLLGAAIGLGLALPFFLAGGLGGGDVKLLTAAGAFLGPTRIWFCLLVMALVGGVMALVAIARQRAFRRTAANLHTLMATMGSKTSTGWKGPESGAAVTLDTPGVIAVPYGVAIGVGALVAWFAYTLEPGWSLLGTLSGWLQ